MINQQIQDSLSPAAATTAEEVMVSSCDRGGRGTPAGDSTTPSSDIRRPARIPTGQEEATPEMEPWAGAVPPVRNEIILEANQNAM